MEKEKKENVVTTYQVQKISGAECEFFLIHDVVSRELIKVCPDIVALFDGLTELFDGK